MFIWPIPAPCLGEVCGIGIRIGALAAGCVGIFMPAIGSFLVAGAFFSGAFFFAFGLADAGICMPGMFICARAGAEAITKASADPKINEVNFTQFSLHDCTPGGEPGGSYSALAIAVLAGAGSAAAACARVITALAVPVSRFALPIFHFHSPFFALPESGEAAYSFRTMVRSQAVNSLSIGKLASAGGVGVETVRFYQRRGLLETPTRGDGIRRYGSEDLRRLRFIKQAQAAGFTLEEIKELLDLDASEDRRRARELAKTRVRELEARIGELKRARSALKRLAKECGSGGPGPCPILAAFDV